MTGVLQSDVMKACTHLRGGRVDCPTRCREGETNSTRHDASRMPAAVQGAAGEKTCRSILRLRQKEGREGGKGGRGRGGGWGRWWVGERSKQYSDGAADHDSDFGAKLASWVERSILARVEHAAWCFVASSSENSGPPILQQKLPAVDLRGALGAIDAFSAGAVCPDLGVARW